MSEEALIKLHLSKPNIVIRTEPYYHTTPTNCQEWCLLKWTLLLQTQVHLYNLFLLSHNVKILFHMKMFHKREEENKLLVFQYSGIHGFGNTKNYLAKLKDLFYLTLKWPFYQNLTILSFSHNWFDQLQA